MDGPLESYRQRHTETALTGTIGYLDGSAGIDNEYIPE